MEREHCHQKRDNNKRSQQYHYDLDKGDAADHDERRRQPEEIDDNPAVKKRVHFDEGRLHDFRSVIMSQKLDPTSLIGTASQSNLSECSDILRNPFLVDQAVLQHRQIEDAVLRRLATAQLVSNFFLAPLTSMTLSRPYLNGNYESEFIHACVVKARSDAADLANAMSRASFQGYCIESGPLEPYAAAFPPCLTHSNTHRNVESALTSIRYQQAMAIPAVQCLYGVPSLFQPSTPADSAQLKFIHQSVAPKSTTACSQKTNAALERNNVIRNHQLLTTVDLMNDALSNNDLNEHATQLGSLLLACPEDSDVLNEHLVLLRQHVEYFQANMDDIFSHTRGRNKGVALRQVGIRCRHCNHISAGSRLRGSTYFPTTLMGIYQAAQNISFEHLQSDVCPEMPDDVKKRFIMLGSTKSAASSVGKAYWAESASRRGLTDTDDGIRFVEYSSAGSRFPQRLQR